MKNSFKLFKIGFLIFFCLKLNSQNNNSLKGDDEAIKLMHEMIETMGGVDLWAKIKQLHFKHIWYPINTGSYLEDEIIDLTGPRSWVLMKSEDFERIRAYSPEFKYWAIHNGEYSENEQSYNNAIKRAPFNIYRVAHAIANKSFPFEIRMGKTKIPTGVKIEFIKDDGEIGGAVVLNGKKEPLVWITPQFRYTFGPMKKFGNLSVPNWAVYNQGSFRYEMIELIGDNKPVDIGIFKKE